MYYAKQEVKTWIENTARQMSKNPSTYFIV